VTTCTVCGRKIVRGTSPLAGTTAVHEQSGERMQLDGTVCRVCLSSAGYVSESAYARMHGEEEA
jgi:hypothetical protein